MRRAVTAALAMLVPAAALLAQEAEGGHAEGWTSPIWHVPMIAWQVVNILLVVGLFIYLLRRPAPEFFKGRAKDIQELLETATRDKEEAQARLKEVEAKMAHLQDEVTAIEESSRQAAEADKARVLAEAETMRERIRKETREEIDRRVVEARRDLLTYAADMAVALAREAFEKSITESDEVRLRADFIEKMTESVHERSR
jgi:F-type H+-transporting ATPase subunit b